MSLGGAVERPRWGCGGETNGCRGGATKKSVSMFTSYLATSRFLSPRTTRPSAKRNHYGRTSVRRVRGPSCVAPPKLGSIWQKGLIAARTSGSDNSKHFHVPALWGEMGVGGAGGTEENQKDECIWPLVCLHHLHTQKTQKLSVLYRNCFFSLL